MLNKLHIALICGGPSLERGISLNSARSVLDHLSDSTIEIIPLYVDQLLNFYELSTTQLYSNTPSDFDFKLSHTGTILDKAQLQQRLTDVDLAFPVIHGKFGEDGELQKLLENMQIPFVGPNSQTCTQMFHKYRASKVLRQHGFQTIPSQLLPYDGNQNEALIRSFFKQHNLKRAIIKPVAGGSSIGVSSVNSAKDAIEKLHELFKNHIDTAALIEPFCHGSEFTIIVLENHNGNPTAMMPSEIEVCYEEGKFFDYRRKYLPTTNTKWRCPPRFDNQIIKEIQQSAEEIFKVFNMHDFARLDGWLLEDGSIVFTDLNPISGMEQNSFLFQQTSRINMSHHDTLRYIVTNACRRNNIIMPEKPAPITNAKKPVKVLFGGNTAERQVSLMSGTNVWLKLLKSNKYQPTPYFLDSNNNVWQLPYTYTLNHTVEEVLDNCINFDSNMKKFNELIGDTIERPIKTSLNDFFSQAKQENAFVFLALHGGDGENGVIQQQLDQLNIKYNGSGAKGSVICMDKYVTGEIINKLNDPMIVATAKKTCTLEQFKDYDELDWLNFWQQLQTELNTNTIIIKPKNDGCSAGIINIINADELRKYFTLATNGATYIPEGAFASQHGIIEMPQDTNGSYLIEPFIETDLLTINQNEIVYESKTNLLEFTIGVMECNGQYHAFNPSITVSSGLVLSLEEKFQGGTGVNITPPPEHILPLNIRNIIKQATTKIAKALSIKNYARLDLFCNVQTGKVIVIEANSLPGLTPATVLYHQALAEEAPMAPTKFLETIIDNKYLET